LCIRDSLLLRDAPSSFVVFEGKRYALSGAVQPDSSATLLSADELYLEYDVEYIGHDAQGRPQVYLCTFTLQEWNNAQQVVRQLVDAMHGEVRVTSRPAEGSTFTVILPLSPT